ncbi:hypothetical protein H4683_004336, partial [Filibacter limicola]|nr:hypothetical protein [Sporosarcina limicola]
VGKFKVYTQFLYPEKLIKGVYFAN